MHDVALAHYRAGRLAEAAECCRLILNDHPREFHALHLLGLIRHAEGASEQAAFFLTAALGAAPDATDQILPILDALATTLVVQEQHEAAIECCRRAIALQPARLDSYRQLGRLLLQAGRPQEAVDCHRQALAIAPHDLESLTELGRTLRSMGRLPDAETQYREALRHRPDDIHALFGLGGVLFDLDRPEEAVACYQRAIDIEPMHGTARMGLGVALAALNRHAEALDQYRLAAAILPRSYALQFNRGLSLLTIGALAAGWEDHEARLDVGGWRSRLMMNDGARLWRGEPDISGKTILLQAEQGLGDTIQFVRYVPMVAERGARVVLGVPPALKQLLAKFPGANAVITPDDPVPPFQLQCPLMSLPFAFGTELPSIPADIPYLRAEPELVASWKRRLGSKRNPRIGIAWSGSATYRGDRRRSMALRDLAPLLREPGFDFHIVQNEIRPSDAEIMQEFPHISEHRAGHSDLTDTAALLSLMDIVISVDTSIAHLAGALGRPTWIMLPYAGEWRWLLDREDSPWYPTAMLFRQAAAGDWAGVTRRVAAALRSWSQHHAPACHDMARRKNNAVTVAVNRRTKPRTTGPGSQRPSRAPR
jgi:Flp pilus assembly protein TadD